MSEKKSQKTVSIHNPTAEEALAGACMLLDIGKLAGTCKCGRSKLFSALLRRCYFLL